VVLLAPLIILKINETKSVVLGGNVIKIETINIDLNIIVVRGVSRVKNRRRK